MVVYVENMLMLESGDMGELVGNAMLFELVNRLIDLDVSLFFYIYISVVDFKNCLLIIKVMGLNEFDLGGDRMG